MQSIVCVFVVLSSLLLTCILSARHVDFSTILRKAVKRTRNALVSSSILTSTTGFNRPQFKKSEIASLSSASTHNSDSSSSSCSSSSSSSGSMLSTTIRKPPTSIFKDMTLKPQTPSGEREQTNRRRTANSFVKDAVQMIGPSVARIDCEREIPGGIGVFGENFR